MNVNHQHFETIWIKKDDSSTVQIIDQRFLPFQFVIEDIHTTEQIFTAIREMHLRGAPLIGAAGALGMYLSTLKNFNKFPGSYFTENANYLKSARPTAINLEYAVDRVLQIIENSGTKEETRNSAFKESIKIINEEREYCRLIGTHGLPLIEDISKKKHGNVVNILTHCNAGWLACIDFGTATAPIYFAHDKGIKVHVWVDETRPRNQGARLTAWELSQHGVPNTVIADNTGGYLMQQNLVDLVMVGSDRTTVTGDVANKIGTYLKALAAHDNRIPFYVALPSSSIDWNLTDGIKQIPIEMRSPEEMRFMEGKLNDTVVNVSILPDECEAVNYAFDITPSRLVTGLITERGICKPDKKNLIKMFPEKKANA